MSTKDRIADVALDLFDRNGVEATSVADICAGADVSNGSFFYAFPNREHLFATLFLQALTDYHTAMAAVVVPGDSAETGIAALLRCHIGWVTDNRPQARFLFEQSKAEWLNRAETRRQQQAENARFAAAIDRWRRPLVDGGKLLEMDSRMFIAQLIGPAQIFCRAWLSGRAREKPGRYCDDLIAGAGRALLP